MEITKVQKRNVKKVKLLITDRPEYNVAREAKKLRSFKKSFKKEETRRRDWYETYEGDEDSDDLISFKKIRKTGPPSENNNKKPGNGSLNMRKTFSRLDPSFGNRREKGIVSNLDLLVIVVSVKNPPLRSGLIDRFLVIGEQNNFDVLICINKVDLSEEESDYMEDFRLYTDLGYRVILTSVRERKGLEELKNYLRDKCSLFMGHSGVGKSSLVNALDPSLNLKVGDVSASTNKGRHTTTSKRLFKFSFGGEVLDAPGIKQLGLPSIKKSDLAGLFPEFRDKISLCRFSNCTHIEESDCAVIEALNKGEITQKRYDSFVRIWRSLPG